MRALMLCVVVLTACGGGRQELRQAVAPIPPPSYTPPPPQPMSPYYPPGIRPGHAGLPGERMPEGERLPRSPNKSVKPVRDEDTVYAADEFPRRAGKAYPYEVGEPFFEVAGDLRGLPKQCAAIMTETIQRVSKGLDKRDVDTTEAICLDAQLYAICVGWQTEGRTDDVAKRARRQADDHALDACSRHSRTPTVMRLVDAVRRSRQK